VIYAAVIGSGVGLKHIEALIKTKDVIIKYLCEKNSKKSRYLKKKFPNIQIISSDKKIFEDKKIKLVCIASYDNYHYEQILNCIKNKKNFYVEKPMCMDVNQLKHIHELLKRNKSISFSSNLVLRTNDLFNKIKKQINLDELFYIEGDYIWGRFNKLNGWRSKVSNYSLILGAAIHMIDLIVWMLEKKPESIYVKANKILTKNTNFKKESFVVILLKFKNGVIAKITANSTDNYNHFHELKIFEKKKTMISNILGKKKLNKINGKTQLSNLKGKYPDKSNRYILLSNYIKYLINNNSKKKNLIMRENFDLMNICFSGIQSLNTNKEIKINYFK
tara:strand:+ start:1418 stop:2416 length:999 start_codon:yes stop_codon:yes gene_type:complete